jgi:hypothetical protein
MLTRTSHSQVTFRRPFRLSGMDALVPAGTYALDVEEERLDTLTVEAWRQTAVVLQITAAGITEYLAVDPQELREAMERDDDTAAPGVAPDPRRRALLRLRRS